MQNGFSPPLMFGAPSPRLPNMAMQGGMAPPGVRTMSPGPFTPPQVSPGLTAPTAPHFQFQAQMLPQLAQQGGIFGAINAQTNPAQNAAQSPAQSKADPQQLAALMRLMAL